MPAMAGAMIRNRCPRTIPSSWANSPALASRVQWQGLAGRLPRRRQLAGRQDRRGPRDRPVGNRHPWFFNRDRGADIRLPAASHNHVVSGDCDQLRPVRVARVGPGPARPIWRPRTSCSTAPAVWHGHITPTTKSCVTTALSFLVPPDQDGIFSSVSSPNWRFGWVAGIGGEMRLFNSNWLARLEYLHYDFGRSDTSSCRRCFPLDHGRAPAATSPPMWFVPGFPTSSIRIGSRSVTPARRGRSRRCATPRRRWRPCHGPGPASISAAMAVMARRTIPSTRPFKLGQVTFPPLSGVEFPRLRRRLPCRRELAVTFGGRRSRARYLRHRHQRFDFQQRQARLRVTQNDKFDPIGSVRARLGYLVTPDVLLYGTGGLGWTQFTTVNEFAPGFVPASLATQSWLFGSVVRRRYRSPARQHQLARPRRISALRLRQFGQLHSIHACQRCRDGQQFRSSDSRRGACRD